MGRMGLPTAPTQSSVPEELTDEELAFAECFARGMEPPKIARILCPGTGAKEKKERKALRKRLWKMVRQDPRIQHAIGERIQGHMLIGLGPAAEALMRRAAKGRPDAIKLLFEATGFHNPRVKHEHTGDIKVTLDMPRPARLPSSGEDEIVDAEVVDD